MPKTSMLKNPPVFSTLSLAFVLLLIMSWVYTAVFGNKKTEVEKKLAQLVASSMPKDMKSIECLNAKNDHSRLCTIIPKRNLNLPTAKINVSGEVQKAPTPYLLESFTINLKSNGTYDVSTKFNGKYLSSENAAKSMLKIVNTAWTQTAAFYTRLYPAGNNARENMKSYNP